MRPDRVGFRARVYAVVGLVPAGEVTTYGDVAAALGSPRAARQVGWALAALPEGTDVPWQRVINARGRISFKGDTPRAVLQRARLEDEGVRFDAGEGIDLSVYRHRFDVEELEAALRDGGLEE